MHVLQKRKFKLVTNQKLLQELIDAQRRQGDMQPLKPIPFKEDEQFQVRKLMKFHGRDTFKGNYKRLQRLVRDLKKGRQIYWQWSDDDSERLAQAVLQFRETRGLVKRRGASNLQNKKALTMLEAEELQSHFKSKTVKMIFDRANDIRFINRYGIQVEKQHIYWSKEEEKKLIELFRIHGKNYQKLSELMDMELGSVRHKCYILRDETGLPLVPKVKTNIHMTKQEFSRFREALNKYFMCRYEEIQIQNIADYVGNGNKTINHENLKKNVDYFVRKYQRLQDSETGVFHIDRSEQRLYTLMDIDAEHCERCQESFREGWQPDKSRNWKQDEIVTLMKSLKDLKSSRSEHDFNANLDQDELKYLKSQLGQRSTSAIQNRVRAMRGVFQKMGLASRSPYLWPLEEVRRLEEAFAIHGRDMNLIRQMFPQRTYSQLYQAIDRIERRQAKSTDCPKGVFVRKKIAKSSGQKSLQQLAVKYAFWPKEETRRLEEAYAIYGRDMDLIRQMFPQRTYSQLYQAINRLKTRQAKSTDCPTNDVKRNKSTKSSDEKRVKQSAVSYAQCENDIILSQEDNIQDCKNQNQSSSLGQKLLMLKDQKSNESGLESQSLRLVDTKTSQKDLKQLDKDEQENSQNSKEILCELKESSNQIQMSSESVSTPISMQSSFSNKACKFIDQALQQSSKVLTEMASSSIVMHQSESNDFRIASFVRAQQRKQKRVLTGQKALQLQILRDLENLV